MANTPILKIIQTFLCIEHLSRQILIQTVKQQVSTSMICFCTSCIWKVLRKLWPETTMPKSWRSFAITDFTGRWLLHLTEVNHPFNLWASRWTIWSKFKSLITAFRTKVSKTILFQHASWIVRIWTISWQIFTCEMIDFFSICFFTRPVGAPLKRTLMTQKDAFMPIICVTLDVLLTFSNTTLKIVRHSSMVKDGICVHMGLNVLNVTLQSNVCTTQININEYSVINNAAIN